MLRRLKIFFALLGALLTVSCSSTPDGIIPHDEMARLMADIHEGEGVVETERSVYTNDSLRLVLRESIYRKHGVTAEQFDSSLVWYGHHIEDYMEVYDEVIKILEERMELANSISVSSSSLAADNTAVTDVLEGDSVDVWSGSRYRRFYPQGGNDNIVYAVTRDHNWEPGDIYTLRFKTVNPRNKVKATIVGDYDDGTYTLTTNSGERKGWCELTLKLDASKTASAVGVDITYPTLNDGEVAYIDSISLVRERANRTPRPYQQQ